MASSSSWQRMPTTIGSWRKKPSPGFLKNQEQQKAKHQQQPQKNDKKGGSHVQDAAQNRRDLNRAEKKIASLQQENTRLQCELHKIDTERTFGQLWQQTTQASVKAAADKARMCSVAKSCHVAWFLVLVLPGSARGRAQSRGESRGCTGGAGAQSPGSGDLQEAPGQAIIAIVMI